ncbi:MAG: DUF63 family protein [Methanothermobacter sp.]|nr:DUF63 family protein [Methanothermobacter sp.]
MLAHKDILDPIIKFLQENFFYLHPGYTLFNTIVFGLVLGLVVLIIIRMFKWIKKDPRDLFLPIIPFIFLGSGARALVDNGVYPLTLFLVTPGIYIIVGLTAIVTLLASVKLEEKFGWNYKHIIFLTGLILSIPNIIYLKPFNLTPFLSILAIWLAFTSIFAILGLRWDLLNDKDNLAVLSVHLFDASTTFVAVDFYGYWEQHVLPTFLTNITNTAFVMFPLKILVILTVLYLIEGFEDKYVKNTLKISIFILGLAPGLRNFLSLCMAT